MNKKQQPFGSLGLSTLEDRLRQEKIKNRYETISELKNSTLIWLGKGLRASVHALGVESAHPTNNRNINKRAGKTAVALLMGLGTLVAVSGIAENSTAHEPCQTVTFEQIANTPAKAATIIDNEIVQKDNANVYDKSLDELIYNGSTEICGIDAVERLNDELRN